MKKLWILIVCTISLVYAVTCLMILEYNKNITDNPSTIIEISSKNSNGVKLRDYINFSYPIDSARDNPESSQTPLNFLDFHPQTITEPIPNVLSPEEEISSLISHSIPNLNSEFSSNSCKPYDFTFTEQEISKYWNFKTYGNCLTKSKAHVKIVDNVMHAVCDNGETPSFHLDDRSPELLGGRIEELLWVNTVNISLGESQYVAVKCDKDSIYSFVFNRFQESISEKAQNIRNSLASKTRPLAVLVLVLDSVSRSSAYRDLKETIQFLTEKNINEVKSKFSIYDFELPNSSGTTTKENIFEILYGQLYESHRKLTRGLPLTSDLHLDLQKNALWTYFSSLGYVTYFSSDTVNNFLVQATGRTIVTDYAFTNFWKFASTLYGYNEFKEGQRCLGEHNAHFYSLNNTYQFYENFKNHNRFGYTHITAAHETTGNIRTVDKDLKAFLLKMFQLFDNDEEDFVIFLISDHGRAIENLQFSVKEHLDMLVPMTFAVINKGLEQRRDSRENLQHNLKRLVTRFDINLSLKALALAPYGGCDQNKYLELKNQYLEKDARSIFNEKISEDRNCEEAGIKKILCICRDYEAIDFSNSYEKTIVEEIVKLGTTFINSKSNEECEEVELVSIESAEKYELRSKENGWDTRYRLTLMLQRENILSILVNFSTRKRLTSEFSLLLPRESNPFSFFVLGDGTEVFLQVTEIMLKNNCNKEICIC